MAHPTPDVLVLVALGEDVDAETLQHVRDCRACFAELESMQQVVTIGRSLGPDDHLVAPHARVWQQISVGLGADRDGARPGALSLLERPVEPSAHEPAAVASGSSDELAARRRSAPRRWGVVAVAAAVALLVGLTGGFLLKGLVRPDAVASGVTQLNALPRWSGSNGTATVEDGGDGQRTLVVTVELPPTVDVDGTMEVWMSDTRAQDMVAMGTMAGSTARFPIPATLDLATHPIIDVSLEPRDDTDPAHSDTSVVRGRLNV